MKPFKKVRLVVAGAAGRMGTRIIDLARKDPRFHMIAGVDRPGSVRSLLGLQGPVPMVTDVAAVINNVDAVIDFSSPEATIPMAERVSKSGIALVVGTTGHSSRNLEKLKALGRKSPIVFSPNMSVGVNVLFRALEQVAHTLAGYDIEIVEAHHNQKKDAPSGTAMRLAEIAARASERSEKDFVYGRKGLLGPRKKKEISVLAVRAGDIVGDHTVFLAGPGERIELTHRAHSRDAFAAGALEAAAWASRRKPGFYNMADVLGLKK